MQSKKSRRIKGKKINPDNKYIRLRIPLKIYSLLKNYKETTGMSITSQIHEATVSWLFLKKIIGLKEISDIKKKDMNKKND